MHAAIAAAEAILPGRVAPKDEPDARWAAMFEIKEFLESDPEPMWPFILKWGRHRCRDLRAAIGCVLLEHILDEHGEQFYPRVRAAAREHPRFAHTVSMCSILHSRRSKRRLARLQADIRRWHG